MRPGLNFLSQASVVKEIFQLATNETLPDYILGFDGFATGVLRHTYHIKFSTYYVECIRMENSLFNMPEKDLLILGRVGLCGN